MFTTRMLNRHAALMDRMAQAMGVDLTDAIAREALSGEGWRDAVESCAGCAEPEDCMAFLADHKGTQIDAVPEYCVNGALMAQLRAAMSVPAEITPAAIAPEAKACGGGCAGCTCAQG